MTPAGFEPAIPASEWPQTHALDRAATGTGQVLIRCNNILLGDADDESSAGLQDRRHSLGYESPCGVERTCSPGKVSTPSQ